MGLLVGGNDMNAPAEPILVTLCDTLIRCAVQQHRMGEMIGLDVIHEPVQIHGFAIF